jgi:hypothetical protein
MMSDSATIRTPASAQEVRAILLDPAGMPGWNPALLSLTGASGPAQVGLRYPVVLRGGFRGHMLYRAVEAARIEIDYTFPILGWEHGAWELTNLPDGGTQVVHTFRHPGIVGRLTAGMFRGVAALRVGRLADLLASRKS